MAANLIHLLYVKTGGMDIFYLYCPTVLPFFITESFVFQRDVDNPNQSRKSLSPNLPRFGRNGLPASDYLMCRYLDRYHGGSFAFFKEMLIRTLHKSKEIFYQRKSFF
jgi:hypothetical protein